MPEKTFIIAHDDNAVTKGEIPLSEQMVDHHLNYLEDDIERCMEEKDINVSVELRGKEAHIALKSQSDKIDLTDELASCLRKINLRTFGLAFVKVR